MVLKREELEEVIDFTKGLLELCTSESQYNAVKKHLTELYEELIDNYIVGDADVIWWRNYWFGNSIKTKF